MPLRFHELLCEWCTPRTSARLLASFNAIPSERVFNDPTLNRAFRELWAAHYFCYAVSARKLRMTHLDQKSSDFEIMQRNGDVLPLQFVEAMEPNRKRGAEYKARVGQENWVTEDPFSEWIRRRKLIPSALAENISKKARKGYHSNVSLLVYLNIVTFGEWRADIEGEMIEAAHKHGSSFRSVWIIWNGTLYRAWPNPSKGARGPIFADEKVSLGGWRQRLEAQKAFRDFFN